MGRVFVRHPVVEEIIDAFDFQVADDKAATVILPVRQRFTLVVGSVPIRLERIVPGREIIN